MKFMFLSRSHFTELFFLNRTEECVIKKERPKSKQQKGEKGHLIMITMSIHQEVIYMYIYNRASKIYETN